MKSFHWPSLKLARAWLRGNNVVLSPSLIVAVILSCFIASVTIDLSVSMTSSRSMLRDSGALSRLLADCWLIGCWIAGVNPTACISGHINPRVLLSFGDAVVTSIFHRGCVSPGVELSFPMWVGPACRCSLTAFLDNVNAVSKCILSCLPGAISLAPSFALSVVDILRLYLRCRLEMK